MNSRLVEVLKKRWQRFFAKRMPEGEKVTLNQRSSYIWPTGTGYLLIAIVLLMLIGATNYQNNLAFLLTFLLIGIGLVSIIFTFKNLQGMVFIQQPCAEAFADQTLSIEIGLKSENRQPHYSIGIGLDYKTLFWCNVGCDRMSRIAIPVKARSRGYQRLPRLVVTSIFPFGWLRTWAYFRFNQPVLVYPKPLEPLAMHERQGNQSEEEGARRVGSEDFYGLKAYQPGEPLSRVDWKSFARERGLNIREFASYQGQQLSFDWQDYPGCDDETRLSYLTFMVLQAANENLCYSLRLPTVHLGPDEGATHRQRCLESLALYGAKKAHEEQAGD